MQVFGHEYIWEPCLYAIYNSSMANMRKGVAHCLTTPLWILEGRVRLLGNIFIVEEIKATLYTHVPSTNKNREPFASNIYI